MAARSYSYVNVVSVQLGQPGSRIKSLLSASPTTAPLVRELYFLRRHTPCFPPLLYDLGPVIGSQVMEQWRNILLAWKGRRPSHLVGACLPPQPELIPLSLLHMTMDLLVVQEESF